MKKAVIFYFSGTGNTWWVSEQLSRCLGERSVETQTVSIEKVSPAEAGEMIAGRELAGFGYPIYGSDLPRLMKDFISSLPGAEGNEAFVFCTQWLWSGDGALEGARFLRRKGFSVRWGEHFLMPNNVCIPQIPLPYTNDPAKLNRKLRGAAGRASRLAGMIASGSSFHRGFNPISSLLGAMQRVPFRGAFPKLQDDIGIDIRRCRQCNYCVELCPSENLVVEGENIATRNRCIICLRCYNFCPHQAITYRGRPHKIKRGIPYRGPVEGFNPKTLV